jgi:site-specific DNA-methyltransferase (adenine-specific)
MDDCSVRLEQADCLEFLRGLPTESVDLIATDPAYSGMNQHLQLGHGRIVGKYSDPDDGRWFREFHDEPESYRAFLNECLRVLRPDRHLYVMFDSFSLLSLGAIAREFFAVKNLIVWDKRAIGMGHYFRRRHEHVLFASKGHRKLSRRDIPDVWSFRRLIRAPYPTQKPVELFEAMLAGSAEPGFVVCDPFLGSGASAIAALRRGCRFVGCDVAPEAIAFARDRIARYQETGRDPAQVPLPDRPAFLGALDPREVS